MPQSGIVVEPTMTAPDSSTRSVTGASRRGHTGSSPAHPKRIGTPTRARFSLMVTGMPSSGPSGSPRAQRRSLARAAASEASGSWAARALTVGSSRSIRAWTASWTSTGEKRDPAYPAHNAIADRSARWSSLSVPTDPR